MRGFREVRNKEVRDVERNFSNTPYCRTDEVATMAPQMEPAKITYEEATAFWDTMFADMEAENEINAESL